MKLTKILLEAGQAAGKLELINTDVETAKKYIENKGVDISGFEFEKNYLYAQKMAKLGKTQRKDMPVIDANDVKQFQERLSRGFIDVSKPFSNTYNPSDPFPQGLSGKSAEEFLRRGIRDTAISDDRVKITNKKVPVKNLKPIQKQIYFDKAADSIAQFGIQATISFTESKTFFITSSDLFIIDGHHRWLAALILDPNMKANILSIALPINKLLPLSLAYGDAIGNQRNS